MIIYAVTIAVLLGSVYGRTSACGNINTYGWTLDDIIDDVIKDADVNNDSYIDVGELRKEILGRWSINGRNVSRNDFVAQFVLQYWDDYRLTTQFFDNMDINHDGYLSEGDFYHILLHWLDPNLNDRVPIANIRQFIHDKHPEGCTQT